MLDKLISEHRHRHHLRGDFVHGRVKQRESTFYGCSLFFFVTFAIICSSLPVGQWTCGFRSSIPVFIAGCPNPIIGEIEGGISQWDTLLFLIEFMDFSVDACSLLILCG